MPVNYSIISNTLWLHFKGFNSPEEVCRAVDSALADPRFVKGMFLLLDVREAESAISVEEIRERAKYYASLKEYITPRCAIVATKAVLFGMSRVFQVFAEGQGMQVHVTTEVEKALLFLGDEAEV